MDHETLRLTVLAAFPAAAWEFDPTWNGAKCQLPWPNQSIGIWDQSGFDDAVIVGIHLEVNGGSRHLWEERCKYDDLPAALRHLRAHLQLELDAASAVAKGLTEILPTFRKLKIAGLEGGEVEIDGRVHPQVGGVDADGEVIESFDLSYLRATGQLPGE